MRVLAWDTSTPFPSVAILEDKRVLAETNLDIGLKHSSHLIPVIDELLKMTGMKLEDIDIIGATIGPGSFTGIRVGLATAKALCFALNIGFSPVISLDALALKEKESQKLIAAIDAKKGEVFMAEYRKGQRIWGPYNAPIEELWMRGPALFIGDGAFRFRELIEKNLGEGARFSERSLFIAAETGKLAFDKVTQGKVVAPDKIFPLYLRASDAEIKKWGK